MTDPHEPDPHEAESHEPDPDRPEVGSVGEEAAKLLGALSGWATDAGDTGNAGEPGAGLGATLGAALGGLGGLAAERLSEVNDHLATGAAECTYCPVCRTVHAIRGTSPEVKAHLAGAASSFFQAVAAALATQPPPGTRGPGDSTGLERIDLDGDDDE
ncbi:hypothetical protein [Nocardioides plantarum]|uniref:Uncharacterized protein n=1 Tax=Nocardioides plantarum TaxID=29299 RepID=A0ABV5KCH1_9ACTN|nr:hypothetical protein [Nocardioides plantarum]